jgi:hypothetical protein
MPKTCNKVGGLADRNLTSVVEAVGIAIVSILTKTTDEFLESPEYAASQGLR